MKQSMSVKLESFELIFEDLKKQVKNELRVGTLGRVTAVDNNTFTVSVQPVVREKINSDNEQGYKYIKLPIIENVPYISGQTPKVNDYVVCLHLDKTKEGLDLINDKTSFIDSNNNRHDLNDCIAIVIKTAEEWNILTIATSKGGTVDVTGYNEIRIDIYATSDSLTQLNSLTETTENISRVKVSGYYDEVKWASLRKVGKALNITDMTDDTEIIIRGKK